MIDKWVNGVKFEVDADLQPYSKGPYSVVYADLPTLMMACKEFNKLF